MLPSLQYNRMCIHFKVQQRSALQAPAAMMPAFGMRLTSHVRPLYQEILAVAQQAAPHACQAAALASAAE
jgi:hypothetical protein